MSSDREYMRQQVYEWMVWGDLNTALDIEQAVDVMMGAYERSTTHANVKLPVSDWCETFYKVMMDSPQRVRFSYLRGARATAARH
jgi:hypothetical protein